VTARLIDQPSESAAPGHEARLAALRGAQKNAASGHARGEGDRPETAPGRAWLRIRAERVGLKFGHAAFQCFDLGAGAGEHFALDVELITGNQVEAAQSLRQDISEVGAQILMRLSHSWRNQRRKSQGNLVNVQPVHHGRHLELVEKDATRRSKPLTIGWLHQNL